MNVSKLFFAFLGTTGPKLPDALELFMAGRTQTEIGSGTPISCWRLAMMKCPPDVADTGQALSRKITRPRGTTPDSGAIFN